jgi:hypothetical protein
MFQEPLVEKYNDVLKKRVALEGELAQTRHQLEKKLAEARTKNKRYLLLLLLLPLLALWWSKKKYITPLEQKNAFQQEVIVKLHDDLAAAKKIRADSVRYVIKKGDMLITIGKLFFNDPAMGYQIGIDNSINSEQQRYHLTPGDTLTIRYR